MDHTWKYTVPLLTKGDIYFSMDNSYCCHFHLNSLYIFYVVGKAQNGNIIGILGL